MKKKTVLVTGASGFLGSYICEALYEAGYEVHALIREKSSRKYLKHDWLKIHDCGLAKGHELTYLLKKVETVIHAAGTTNAPTGEGFEKIREYMSERQKTEFDDFLSRYFDYGKIFTKSEKDLSALNAEYVKHFGAAMKSRGLEMPEMTEEELALSGGWMVHALYLSLGMKYDLREELTKVRVPVLVLHGEKDMFAVKASREYTDLFPNGELLMIPKATHFPFVEKPEEFGRIVGEFLINN